MTTTHWSASVSFAQTPLAEIGSKLEEILALGWKELDRGDPWAVVFRKHLPESVRDPEAELREVMGEYWMTADDIRELRAEVAKHYPTA